MSYAVSFTVSNSLWMTTVGDENPTIRKRHRGRLRAMARQTWRKAKRDGAPFTRRYLMLVTVGGRQESPVLACETLKPLIDAGTDEGLWPDDDPAHRVMTCYLRDPRPLPGGHATINIWVVPLGEYDDPTLRLLRCVPGAQAALVSVSIPDSDWLTSNMRESDAVRKRKQTAIMRRAAKAWGNKAMGAHMGVICNVGYPDPHYLGDPDNTAEFIDRRTGCGRRFGSDARRPADRRIPHRPARQRTPYARPEPAMLHLPARHVLAPGAAGLGICELNGHEPTVQGIVCVWLW